MMLAAGDGAGASIFLELGIVIVGLALLARIAIRTGFSPIPLYLLAGLVFGAVRDTSFSQDFIEVGGQIGVILLLFMLGLEYSASELSSTLRSGFRAGVLDALLNFTPGLLAGLVIGWGWLPALLLGGVTYISSSGVIAKVITDLGRLGNRETPAILSILVIEDLVMAFYLPLIAVLLVGGGLLAGLSSVAIAVAAAGVALVVALRFGGIMSRAIFHRSDEVLLLSTLGIVLLVAGAAEELRVSAAVGAFLVGIALSGQVAERAETLVMPLRDFFAATFFVFFGLQIDIGELPGVLPAAAAIAAFTAATKIWTGVWAARRIGVALRGRWRAGTALIARGEFSIVIAGLGVAAGLDAELGALAAGYVLILAVFGPLATRYSDGLVDTVRLRLAVPP
ncbi:MAG: cation:proton antiporter [Actinomycetia bacterium]|nr:cation:proton antiporter [Actinomycetes bacterium]